MKKTVTKIGIKSHKKVILTYLNWGDNNKDLNAIVGNRNETKTGRHINIEKSEDGLNELNEGISFKSSEDPSHQQKLRRQPNRVRDYISEEGLSEEKKYGISNHICTQ